MSENLVEIAGVKFHSSTELEKWRAETLLKKEPETIAWLNKYAKSSSVFYDIGANVGSYSLYASILNPNLDIYSFEPVQENFSGLLNNISLNDVKNVNAFRAAVAKENKLTELFIQDNRVGNSGAQIDTPIDERGNTFKHLNSQKVICMSLNYMIKDLGFPVPNFIKIDVDGHENDIVDGMSDVLGMAELQSILVEFNSEVDIEKYTAILKTNSFAPDSLFNNLSEHSSKRRAEKKSVAVNCVFTKS